MKELYEIIVKNRRLFSITDVQKIKYFANFNYNFNIFNENHENIFKYRKDMYNSVFSLYTMVKYLCTHSDNENTNVIKNNINMIDIFSMYDCEELLIMAIQHNRRVMIVLLLRGGYGYNRDIVMRSLHHLLSDDMQRLSGKIISRRTQICVLRQFLKRWPHISFSRYFFADMCCFGTVDIIQMYMPPDLDILWLYHGIDIAIKYKRKKVASYLSVLLQNNLNTIKNKIENL